MKLSPEISISIVSHLQLPLVSRLLGDLAANCKYSNFELILTLNLDEVLPFELESFPFPIKVIKNCIPLGFGANHNQAFSRSSGHFFCVMNPDIRLDSDPFSVLLACLDDSLVGLAAPLILGPNGHVEASARYFPSPLKILAKLFNINQSPDYVISDASIYPDWIGGMFMLFTRENYSRLGGFDDRFFLYYEDVDICARLKLLGLFPMLCPQSIVIHYAQRSSHKSFKYFCWHMRSMVRFFFSPIYLRLILSRIWGT